VAANFTPQMRMIRILVPLATPPYIIATSVTPSGIMVVMSETDSTVDFVESVERNTKRGKKKRGCFTSGGFVSNRLSLLVGKTFR